MEWGEGFDGISQTGRPVAPGLPAAEKAIEKTSIIVGADENQMMQVLGNLLSNAIKFSSGGVTVELALTRQDNNAIVRVIDYGSGITARFKNTLFDKFTQVDASDSRNNRGNGLGLAITKTIKDGDRHNN